MFTREIEVIRYNFTFAVLTTQCIATVFLYEFKMATETLCLLVLFPMMQETMTVLYFLPRETEFLA